MVGCFRQHACNHAPLLGHLQTTFDAEQFELRFPVRHVNAPYTGPQPGYSWRRMTVHAHHSIDITGEVCPMTFVRTKLKLERMQAGEVLSVRLRGDEPLRNVPRAAREEGHAILAIEADGGDHVVTIRRGGS
ncbi:MAG: sulfurtransferase TusA family protein [Reyranella sp.]|uniref:sulfurtransferase TusA family protein n=2 Tax=Reyranella sp. TaxID=1929291 RepID=UPI003D0DFCF5